MTWLMFLVGSLALVGVPPFAGFWSKDAILASALARGGTYGWILLVRGSVGALLTGIYTFRLFFLVFYGEPSELVLEHAEGHGDHSHGPGGIDRAYRARTARGATVHDRARRGAHGSGGHRAGCSRSRASWHPFGNWVGQLAEPLVEPTTAQDWGTSAVAVAARSRRRSGSRGRSTAPGGSSVPALPAVRRVLEHKFYFDELYDVVAHRPAVLLAERLRTHVEAPLVEGSLDEIASAGRVASAGVARVQSGLLRSYAVAIAVSAVALVVVFIAVR